MKRRLFLVILLACAALTPARAAAQGQPQEATPDRITVEEFKALRAAGRVSTLDVRYQIDKKIRGALHVPLDQLESRLAELPRDREVVAYCS
ncbi:MAG TPA: rhodanese-like domain-containing protein [Pyrinomonadaceae bacterium]|jgi:opacity protein-like surface antigen